MIGWDFCIVKRMHNQYIQARLFTREFDSLQLPTRYLNKMLEKYFKEYNLDLRLLLQKSMESLVVIVMS